MLRVMGGLSLVGALLLAMIGVSPATAQDDAAEATIAALQTQVAELGGNEPTPTPSLVAESIEESSASVANPKINVEVILDVSGSMAQVLPSGETRMDAAKRVLNDVVAAIPNRPGVNVGLRIYGHEGDNSEAGQTVSCLSSELVVSVEGVARDELAGQIAQLVPTGWTPIGLSLERAASDFPEATEGVANAVVLVTDGLETCGGDPVAAAASLKQGSAQAATHVIGFALTPEEQQLLAGISEAGGGMLLGAGNAEELASALFSVLEELEIVVGNGYMGGNAFSLIPAGPTGELAIVARAIPVPGDTSMAVVVRNNTADDAFDVGVSVVAKDASGRVVAAADDQGIAPFHVAPGTLGIGHIYFEGTDIPTDATFEFRVDSAQPRDLRYKRTRDLEVAEASLFEDRIVGQLRNPQDGALEGIVSITVTCFDLDGAVIGDFWDFEETSALPPGDLLPFQATVSGTAMRGCPAFLVAASGQCPTCSPLVAATEPRASSAPAGGSEPAPTDGTAPAEDDGSRFAPDPIPGVTGAALRSYRFTGGGLADIVFVNYAVLGFDSAEHADAALEEAASRYFAQREEPIQNLLPSPPPRIGDRAIAFTGKGANEEFDISLAVLAVRHGANVHFLIGSSLGGDPLPMLEDVAFVGLVPISERERMANEVPGLNEGGLWNVLPRPESLGDEFRVDDEFVPKMFGPVGGPSTIMLATPAAE